MNTDPKCPNCSSEHVYQDRNLWICPECSLEWEPSASEVPDEEGSALVVKDAHGNLLSDGDTVTVIKDLKIKGSSSVVKAGTKAKGIRLVESDDGHNIACRLEGVGAMNLKSEFVKKS